MTSIVTEVQAILKEFGDTNTQVHQDYIKILAMYQNLINKGVTSKRQSQLLSISDKFSMIPVHFNNSEQNIYPY